MSYLANKFAILSSCLLLSAVPAAAQQVERGPAGLPGVPVENRAIPQGAAVDSMAAAVVEPGAMAARAVPFGPGERATYQVRVGLFGGVGNGVMEVVGVEEVRGHPTYDLRLTIKGGVPFFRVDTRFESWLDVARLVSRRFEQDQNEGKYKRHRVFEFYPEEKRWERLNSEDAGELPTELPLDDVSFLYFVRTLPLEVGKTYTFPRYFKEDGNPVVLKVLRNEKISVPVGTFETIVVQPIIKTSGLFGDGGKAEVYFTDDDRRILVQMKSRVPILKSLNLVLDSYVPGKQVAGAGVAADTGAVGGGSGDAGGGGSGAGGSTDSADSAGDAGDAGAVDGGGGE
jgi:hypothetical protein